MPIVNVPIHVPTDLAVRIVNGELYRDGSVVRDAITKRIVKHLNEADGDVTAAAGTKVLAVARANPAAALAAVVGVGAVATSTVIAVRKRSTKATIQRFEVALLNYFKETDHGRISTDVIDELNSAWSATKSLPGKTSRRLQQSPTVSEAKQAIASFTLTFATANNGSVPDFLAVNGDDRDLSDYLEVQRRILDPA